MQMPTASLLARKWSSSETKQSAPLFVTGKAFPICCIYPKGCDLEALVLKDCSPKQCEGTICCQIEGKIDFALQLMHRANICREIAMSRLSPRFAVQTCVKAFVYFHTYIPTIILN